MEIKNKKIKLDLNNEAENKKIVSQKKLNNLFSAVGCTILLLGATVLIVKLTKIMVKDINEMGL